MTGTRSINAGRRSFQPPGNGRSCGQVLQNKAGSAKRFEKRLLHLLIGAPHAPSSTLAPNPNAGCNLPSPPTASEPETPKPPQSRNHGEACNRRQVAPGVGSA